MNLHRITFGFSLFYIVGFVWVYGSESCFSAMEAANLSVSDNLISEELDEPDSAPLKTKKDIDFGEEYLLANTTPKPRKPPAPILALPYHGQPNPDGAHTLVNVHDLFKTSPNDSSCRKYSNANIFNDGTFEITPALVSFPGSGNSWLRIMLAALTGMFVNAIYPEKVNLANGSYGVIIPQDCRCTLLKKNHDFPIFTALSNQWAMKKSKNAPKINISFTETVTQFDGNAIFVIRNPFKAIISYRNFQFGVMSGMAPADAFNHNLKFIQGRMGWDRWVTYSTARWETLAVTWIRNLNRGGVVYYENLKKDPESELRRLLKMLSFPSVDEERMRCVVQYNQANSFKRNETGRNHAENPYTKVQAITILRAIDNVQIALKERGLDPLPVADYELIDLSKY